MPSPDNALPSNGTAQTDARVAPATSGVEVLPSAMPESGPLSVTPAATTTVSSVDDGPRQVDTSTVDASEIEAREGASDPAVEPGAASAEGEVSPAGPRKRRRRRRKKGAQAQGAGAHSPGHGADGVTVESGPSEANAPRSPVDADPPKPKKEGEGTAPRVEGKAGGTKSRKRHADKARAKRDPRERPVFGVGDVVFGKILEIKEDSLIVDLSGKAKAIFDRAEMLLPDDTPEAPSSEKEPVHGDGAGLEASAREAVPEGEAALGVAEEAVREHAEGVAPPSETSSAPTGSELPESLVETLPAEESKGEVDAAPSDGDVAPSVTSGGAERKHAGRRIIVAAGARAVEGELATPPAAPAATASLTHASTVVGGPEVLSPAGIPIVRDAEVAEGALAADPNLVAPAEYVESVPGDETEAKDDPPPKAAPYAPPIVLEIGAHFVALVHNDGARGGLIVLTRHPRRASHAKGMVSAAFREKKTVKGLVTGLVKGGVEVDVDGLRAFVPGSHMDLRLGTDLSRFIGDRLEFSVTQYAKRGRDVVLSRKAQLEAEARAWRAAALAKLPVGSVVEGTVKSVVAFGAFVDVGGVEGLVSLPEMSHSRADAPSDVFKVGETTKVKILRIDDKGKVWLSRRAASPDPRLEALKKYAVGTRHSGKVVRLQPFGAFVELETGIDGLIHTLDLSIKRIEHPSEVVKVGDVLDVVVSQFDGASQKIALHPAPTGAASDEPSQRVQIHKPLKVVVVAIESGGLVVRVMGATGRAARGFITSAATGTARGTELRKPFPVGTQLEAKVVEFDPKRGDLKLSIKALREDTERSAYQQYRQQVHREAKFGTFGDLLAKKGLTTK
jgi:ribosomal protein S1